MHVQKVNCGKSTNTNFDEKQPFTNFLEDSFDSWCEALSRHGKRGRSCSALRALVKRLGAWCGSTCGVERLFSKLVRVEGSQQADISPKTLLQDAVGMTSWWTLARASQMISSARPETCGLASITRAGPMLIPGWTRAGNARINLQMLCPVRPLGVVAARSL